MVAEVRRMMSDPSFRAQFDAMQQRPEFKSAMQQGASAMAQMQSQDPAGVEAMRRRMAGL